MTEQDTRPVALITPATRDVLHELMRDGADTKEIGRRLRKADDTVKSQLRDLFQVFGVKTRTELMAAVYHERFRVVVTHDRGWARRKGVVSPTHEGTQSSA
jgi:DNA-binding NarL/FixJ family response regulator